MQDEFSNWVDGVPRTYKEVLADKNRLVLSVREVAELLGISTCTVHAYRARGLLWAPDTFGGRVLITKASLERFLTEPPPRDKAPPKSEPPLQPATPRAPRKRGGKTDDGFNLDAFRRRTPRRA